MNITVVGVGNAGSTIAADLTNKGHQVTLLKTSNKLHNEHYEKLKQTKSIFVKDYYIGNYIANIFLVTEDVELAISSADVIIIYIQTNYHRSIIKKIAPFIKDNQVIIFEPGYLSTCYLLQECDKDIVCIEAESSPIDCRITSPCECEVLFKNVLNPFGVYPKHKKNFAEQVLTNLGYPFRFTHNVIEAALHNPNLIVHTIGAIFSIPRIEYTKGEYWMYKEVFSPHVWNICEKLDDEKIAILNAVGVKYSQRYVEAAQERNFVNDNREPIESFFDYAYNSSPKGPSVPDSRYITEDVSQGLVLLESLGKVLNISTNVCTALIDIANAALMIDFRAEGRTVETLGKENIEKIISDGSEV